MSRRPLVARNVDRGTELAGHLEVADSLRSRFMGLMGRARLAPDTGLWLTGTNGIHMMFMRFAIDVVFVARPTSGPNGSRRVVALRRALPPWRGVVWRAAGASGVVELPIGAIDTSGTAVGDEIAIEAA